VTLLESQLMRRELVHCRHNERRASGGDAWWADTTVPVRRGVAPTSGPQPGQGSQPLHRDTAAFDLPAEPGRRTCRHRGKWTSGGISGMRDHALAAQSRNRRAIVAGPKGKSTSPTVRRRFRRKSNRRTSSRRELSGAAASSRNSLRRARIVSLFWADMARHSRPWQAPARTDDSNIAGGHQALL